MNTSPIKDLKELPDHLNTLQILQKFHNCVTRIEILEKQVSLLQGNKELKPAKPKKELTRVGSFRNYIDEVLADGRVWSVYSMFEQIKVLHPELPPFKILGVQGACGSLYHRGLIDKVANMHYRKKA